MNRPVSVMMIAAIGIVVGGCGKLSNSKAEELIREKHFGDKDALLCELGAPVMDAPGGRYMALSAPGSCMRALVELGAITSPSNNTFKLGPKSSVDRLSLEFPCGRRIFTGVTSITTGSDGKTATVKYTRAATVDNGVLSKVSSCALRDPPKDGDAEREVQLVKDDSGSWRIK